MIRQLDLRERTWRHRRRSEMKLTDLFLAQLEREAGGTRRALERVPEGHENWKPHEKSMPLGYLAALVATLPGWIAFMVTKDELDIASPEGAKFKPEDRG